MDFTGFCSRIRFYIVEITSSDHIRTPVNMSVAWTSMSGYHPSAEQPRVSSATGIRTPVSGSDNRFVSRKYIGMLLKYRYANGPVVI